MYTHVIYNPFLITALATSVIAVIGVLTGKQYTIFSFPPRQCVEGERNFYNYVVPSNILFAIGFLMLVVILWKIHKVGDFM